MSEWISVNDQLPEFDRVVIVCYPSGYNGEPLYAFGARLDDSDGWLWGIQTGYSGGIYAKSEAGDNSIEADDDYPVQFWRPLPEPPSLTIKGDDRA